MTDNMIIELIQRLAKVETKVNWLMYINGGVILSMATYFFKAVGNKLLNGKNKK